MASLVFRCRRCGQTVTEDCAAPDIEIRRRIETGQTFTLHECPPAMLGDGLRGGGALGLCELLGEGERSAPPKQESAA
jgi:hypothetical protein